MRVLVTGASGLLGGRLACLLAARYELTAARHVAPLPAGLREVPLELGSEASLARALDATRAQAVVHAAAWADVDACEREPEQARRLNWLASQNLAGLCRERGVRLVALSTDLVLSGERAFSDETAEPVPRLVYGATKRAAELTVLSASAEFAVLRVPLVAGRGFGARSTASEGVLWALHAGRPLRLFTDQHRTPVDPESLADLVERVLARADAGLFHAGGGERLSRHELGLRVARAHGLDAGLIEPVLQSRRPVGVVRPADCSLDSSRARRELGWEPRPLDAALRESRPWPD